MFNRLKALTLLAECTGDDIWSLDHCRLRGVPEEWLEHLTDCFESGYRSDSHTIYLENRPILQYEGIRDVDLAVKLGEYLAIEIDSLRAIEPTRAGLVRAIYEAAFE